MGKTNLVGSILISIVLAFIGGLMYMQSQKAIKAQTVAACIQAGRIIQNKSGEQVNIPENYWFNVCLKKAGLQPINLTDK